MDRDFHLYIKDKGKNSQNKDGWSDFGPHELFFYNDNDEPIGFAKLTKSEKLLSVNMIYLEPESRGFGYGTSFYSNMLDKGFSFKSDSEITEATAGLYKKLAEKYNYNIVNGRIIINKEKKR